MKLYYAPGTCALASHIVAREAGIDIGLEKVDLKSKKTASGRDYLAINPKGYVPALELDDGSILTEGPVVSQYLADLKPGSKLAAANGTIERYRLQEMLGYINSEIHKTYSPLFNPKTHEETRQERLEYLRKRYALVEHTLEGKQFLFGDVFTIADAYLFVVTRWSKVVKLDLSDFRNVLAFQKRVAERPAVQTALREEDSR
ncbi:MAG TPA: glutathione transferase GstA [Woeseiaceae bacterium]|nr:glutathione transferase GstA [Woeseiaceae bacterium]